MNRDAFTDPRERIDALLKQIEDITLDVVGNHDRIKEVSSMFEKFVSEVRGRISEILINSDQKREEFIYKLKQSRQELLNIKAQLPPPIP